MALYTELFSEYVEGGGELPSEFASINGFADLFKMRYFNREIGFETEALFTMKLQLKASVIIPFYVEKLTALATAQNALRTPNFKRTTTETIGNTEGNQFALPFDTVPVGTTIEPSLKTTTEEAENERVEEVEGVTVDENLRIIEYLHAEREKVLNTCLDEFNDLFMAIY